MWDPRGVRLSAVCHQDTEIWKQRQGTEHQVRWLRNVLLALWTFSVAQDTMTVLSRLSALHGWQKLSKHGIAVESNSPSDKCLYLRRLALCADLLRWENRFVWSFQRIRVERKCVLLFGWVVRSVAVLKMFGEPCKGQSVSSYPSSTSYIRFIKYHDRKSKHSDLGQFMALCWLIIEISNFKAVDNRIDWNYC